MPLKKNQVVTITFELKNRDGKIIEATSKDNPFSFISGADQVLPMLEHNIGEMLIGSKRVVVLEPENAYGIYEEDAIQVVDRSEFPQESELKVGMEFIADTPDGGQMPFTIKSINENNIELDFNHPLAGLQLTFDIELLNLRDATQEELAHGHVHGAGGHHHH